LVAPPTHGAFRAINRKVLVPRVVRDLRALAGEGPVVVAYPPTRTTLDILDGLRPRVLLYDCAENYEGFPGVPEDIGRTEGKLLARADLVSCTSRFLLEKVGPIRPDAFQRMPSVDFELFHRAYRPPSPGAPIRKVCYFGGLGAYRFDFDVVEGLADAGYEVSLIGDARAERPRVFDHPNVRHTPPVEQEELPALLRPADALIIPYKITGLTRGVFPAKTFECLATGKPVVASPLPDLKDLSEHVYLAASPEEYVDALRCIPQMETEDRVRARLELARRNSREARFRMIEEAIWRKLR
jgi:glycosyltransferase involved in cell wall biosynthesis